MQRDENKFAEEYRICLSHYLEDENELWLSRGYELSREALINGLGILDVASAHHQALLNVLAHEKVSDKKLQSAAAFFIECLSPFEMSHRGAKEGARALRHLNEVLEGELKRIAHALHDEAGQLLATVHLAIASLANEIPTKAQGRIVEIQELIKQIELELRNLSHELRPTVLDNLGLLPAIEFLAGKVSRRTHLSISVRGDIASRMPVATETALYRIVQEALNNVVKHAGASHVWISLQSSSTGVTCSIHDNGCGFVVTRQSDSAGMGLMGVRERLNALGGSLQIISAPKTGTTLKIEIPPAAVLYTNNINPL